MCLLIFQFVIELCSFVFLFYGFLFSLFDLILKFMITFTWFQNKNFLKDTVSLSSIPVPLPLTFSITNNFYQFFIHPCIVSFENMSKSHKIYNCIFSPFLHKEYNSINTILSLERILQEYIQVSLFPFAVAQYSTVDVASLTQPVPTLMTFVLFAVLCCYKLLG